MPKNDIKKSRPLLLLPMALLSIIIPLVVDSNPPHGDPRLFLCLLAAASCLLPIAFSSGWPRLTGIIACLLLLAVSTLNMMGHGLLPEVIIQHLRAPAKIVEIKPDGLLATDGRTLPINHIKAIPTDLPVLKDAVRDGVQECPNGDLIGILEIRHWYGADRVRVDLSSLLLLAGAGPLPDKAKLLGDRTLHYERHSLSRPDFLNLRIINKAILTDSLP